VIVCVVVCVIVCVVVCVGPKQRWRLWLRNDLRDCLRRCLRGCLRQWPCIPPDAMQTIYGEGFVKPPVQGMGGRSLLHIPVAFGVGRSCPSQPHRRDRCAFCCKSLEPEAEGDSPSVVDWNEREPTWRDALNHLFGIV
jgi:hypothetical protein